MPARGQSNKNNTAQGVFFCCGPGGVFFFCSGPVPAPNGTSPSPAFPRGRRPWVVFFFFALAPCRRPTGLLLPLPFPGAAAKKNTPWVVFFFCSGPVPARGFSFPCLSPGPEQKTTPWVVFFLLWPCRKVAAPNGAQQKKHFAHPGPTAKNFLETNDAGHEQKGATTKKNTLAGFIGFGVFRVSV